MMNYKYILFLCFLLIGNKTEIRSQTHTKEEGSSYAAKNSADSLLNIGIKQQESGNFAESVIYFNKSLSGYYEHKDFKSRRLLQLSGHFLFITGRLYPIAFLF
jgi:hypothetical protein